MAKKAITIAGGTFGITGIITVISLALLLLFYPNNAPTTLLISIIGICFMGCLICGIIYQRFFAQADWEEKQTELLKYIYVVWNNPKEYLLHMRSDGNDSYRKVKGYPLTIISDSKLRSLFITEYDGDWRISESTTGLYLYKSSSQETVLTKLVNDVKIKGTHYIHNVINESPKLIDVFCGVTQLNFKGER